MVKIHVTKTISMIKIKFASFVGQPNNSVLLKRGNFNKFLLDKNATVAVKANNERISMKLIKNV